MALLTYTPQCLNPHQQSTLSLLCLLRAGLELPEALQHCRSPCTSTGYRLQNIRQKDGKNPYSLTRR